jgi:hypothetical protein
MALAPFSTNLLDDFFSPFGLMASFPSQRQSQLTQRPNDQPLLRNIPLDITGARDNVVVERMALLLIMHPRTCCGSLAPLPIILVSSCPH